jgi:hypothetical protein
MAGERIRKELYGQPFNVKYVSLIDSKPDSLNCIAIVHLERD